MYLYKKRKATITINNIFVGFYFSHFIRNTPEIKCWLLGHNSLDIIVLHSNSYSKCAPSEQQQNKTVCVLTTHAATPPFGGGRYLPNRHRISNSTNTIVIFLFHIAIVIFPFHSTPILVQSHHYHSHRSMVFLLASDISFESFPLESLQSNPI